MLARRESKGCQLLLTHSRDWHESEVPALFAHVGYRGKTGQHLLTVRFSGFDPEPT
jgi:hypothetical protein